MDLLFNKTTTRCFFCSMPSGDFRVAAAWGRFTLSMLIPPMEMPDPSWGLKTGGFDTPWHPKKSWRTTIFPGRPPLSALSDLVFPWGKAPWLHDKDWTKLTTFEGARRTKLSFDKSQHLKFPDIPSEWWVRWKWESEPSVCVCVLKSVSCGSSILRDFAYAGKNDTNLPNQKPRGVFLPHLFFSWGLHQNTAKWMRHMCR